MSLARYLQYRDSGERWLGAVPAHWDVLRLKTLFEIRKRIVGEEGHQVLSITQRGIKVKDIESNDGQLSMDYSKYQVVRPGDFAMNHMDLLTGFVDISQYAGVTSPDYRVFGVRDGVRCEPRYFLYLLQNGYRQKVFYAFGQGASEFGRWRFPTDQFNDFRFPFPPADEQSSIAAFLDRETAKIDALIAEQEKLTALLAEKRQATISHAVTRGLDPNAPMKDSGVAWLGKVPAHWQVKQLKHLAKPGTAITYGIVQAGPHHEGGIPYIRTSDMAGDKLPLNGYALTSPEIDSSYSRSKVAAGDIVIAIRATVGKCLPLPPELAGANLTQGTAKVSPGAEVTTGFLLSSLRSSATQTYFDSMAKGATFKEITLDALRRTPVVVPPAEEQREIEAFVNVETSKLNSLRSSAEHAIDLLRERRSALIAAAVTGQIDVRTPPEAQHLGGNDVPHAHRQGAVARQNL